MLSTLFLALWGAVASSLPAGSLQGSADPLPQADPAITRAELEHHVRFLASDELGGRAPMTPGMERAAQYLAKALSTAGIAPAGEKGTYFQSTGLERFDYPEPPRLIFTDEAGAPVEARHGADFLLRVRGHARGTEKLPLRFFYDYNHARMPREGNPGEALYFSATKAMKGRILAEKGIEHLEDWGLEFELLASGRERTGQVDKNMPPRIRLPGDEEREGCELVQLRGQLVDAFELRKFTHVQLLVEEHKQPFEDRNVVGRIRGVGTPENPALAEEVVLLSAHYDHLGIREAPRARERDDSIHNGADDDASGCAVLLEIAQAIAAGPKPARTVVVLFTTGEESGGKGIRRYIDAPAEPLAKTVMNLNLEMLGRPDVLVGGPGRLWVTGAERTSVGFSWRELGILGIEPDPRPKEGFFERSDNYALALEGVVAQTLSSFAMHREYHSPRDEADTLDYEHLLAAGELAGRAAQALVDGAIVPFWMTGGAPEKRKPVKTLEPRSEEERAAARERRKALREETEQAGESEDGDEEADGGEDDGGEDDGREDNQ